MQQIFRYAYDLRGNRRSVSNTINNVTQMYEEYTYNENNTINNRLLGTGNGQTVNQSLAFTYDAAGNMTSDGVNTHTYDRANRLTGYTAPSSYTMEFHYDTVGNRVWRSITETALNRTTVTTSVLDAASPLPEALRETVSQYTGTDQNSYQVLKTRHLLPGLGSFEGNPLTSWEWSFFMNDLLGSVRGIMTAGVNYDFWSLNETQYAIGYAATYDPFGAPLEQIGYNPTDLGFAGQVTDPNGLLHMGDRYLKPLSGTFLTGGAVTGTNSYAVTNPTTMVDPSGRLLAGVKPWLAAKSDPDAVLKGTLIFGVGIAAFAGTLWAGGIGAAAVAGWAGVELIGLAGEKAQLLFGRAEDINADMAKALKVALALLKSDRGGGRPNFAQGGGVAATIQDVQTALKLGEHHVQQELQGH